jgi:transglutaminase-like putative cysteine protease
MIYSVRHITTFRYQSPVRESVMEVRMLPRSEGHQRCLRFTLDVTPGANITQYCDPSGNTVHHFDIAGSHNELKVVAHSTVQVQQPPVPIRSEAGDWSDLDAMNDGDEYYEMLMPSDFAHSSEALEKFAKELRVERRNSPLDLLTELNETLYRSFSYVPNSTNVDSPIEDALQSRRGVCQDFAHIMIALVRPLRIPCRYVSGYLFHRDDENQKDRSLEGASHAWIEAFIPHLGWTAFDPTNNLIGGIRHIRVAIGRDYADVPPTRGVHKGGAHGELSVAVTVSPSELPPPQQTAPSIVIQSRPVYPRLSRTEREQQQQQQQQ